MAIGNRGGRPPKPTALKIVTGNPGKRPLAEDEPQPAKGLPEMPRWLSEAARAEWRRVIKTMGQTGVITQADGTALAVYCSLWARVRAGFIAGERGGGFVAEVAQMRAAGAAFGLDPGSRTRLHVPVKKEEGDELDALMRGSK